MGDAGGALGAGEDGWGIRMDGASEWMGHQNGWVIREAGERSERRLPKVGEGGHGMKCG